MPASFSTIRLAEVQRATSPDKILQAVMQNTLSEWSGSVVVYPENLKRYYSIRSHLSISDQLLLHGDCIYVPQGLQPFSLDRIHDAPPMSHQILRARQFMCVLGEDYSRQNVMSTTAASTSIIERGRSKSRLSQLSSLATRRKELRQTSSSITSSSTSSLWDIIHVSVNSQRSREPLRLQYYMICRPYSVVEHLPEFPVADNGP